MQRSTADSQSPAICETVAGDKLARRRQNNRRYRDRIKQERRQMKSDLEKLGAEHGQLKHEHQEMNSNVEKLVAENERLKNKLERKNTETVPLWEWIFVVSNLTAELPSAVFDELSSPHKPLYALMAMALSLLALVLCVLQLFYKGVKEGITFKCPRDKIAWFYYPSRSQNHKRFGTFADLIGLVSAISQCIVTAVNYDFARRAASGPIKFSLLPIIFALGLLCSKILETVEKKASERQGR